MLLSGNLALGEVTLLQKSQRDSTVGRADYSGIDFDEDVKCVCACEAGPLGNDIFNELVT